MKVVASEERGAYYKKGAEFCCEEMRDAWGHAIGFGAGDPVGFNRDTHVNIRSWSCYPEGSYCDDIPIRFCPFCGAPVVVEMKEAE